MELLTTKLGRKFLICMYTQTSLFVLLYMGKLPADTFEFLTMIVIGGYVGGNITQRAIEGKR